MKTLEKQSLFWDVDIETLNAGEHRDFIAKRILSVGDLDDLAWSLKEYGAEFLKALFLRSADGLDAKSCNFWKRYFYLSDEDLCISKRSSRVRSAFSMR